MLLCIITLHYAICCENNDKKDNKDRNGHSNTSNTGRNEKKMGLIFGNLIIGHQCHKITIHHRGKYTKYLASLLNEILFQSLSHCLLDALLCDFYYGGASSRSIKKQQRRLMDINKLEYGTNLFTNVIGNYQCVQFIATFCGELPHRFVNKLFEQLKP